MSICRAQLRNTSDVLTLRMYKAYSTVHGGHMSHQLLGNAALSITDKPCIIKTRRFSSTVLQWLFIIFTQLLFTMAQVVTHTAQLMST